MPLAPRYSWSETDDSVVIQLQGVAIKDQSQLLCGDAFVKVNAPPYLLVLDLHKDVDEEASRATVQGSSLTLSLKKRESGSWGRLTAEGGKDDLRRRRDESIQRAHKRQADAAEARVKRKQQEERDAVDRRLALDRQRRETIEARQKQELADERGRLVQWQEGLGPGGADSGTGGGDGGSGRDQGDELDYEDEADDEAPPAGSAEGKTQQAGRPGEPGAEAGGLSGSSEQAEGKERSTTGAGAAGDEASSKSHPDYFGRGWWPSAKGQRQSSGPATAAASAAVGGAAGGGESGGSNGDGNGNGRGAEDAAGIYAEGGKCDEPIAAPCGEVEGAAEAAECIVEQQPGADGGVKSIISSGLSGSNPADAPEPLVPMPAPAPRPRSLVPVKVSFTPLETPHLPAREQREEELRLHKKGADAQAAVDSADIADRQPAFLKDKGDALFKQGNFGGAVNAYSRALQLEPPDAAPLLSNRAVAHLKLGDAAACRADCSEAVELVKARLARLETAGALGGGAASGSASGEGGAWQQPANTGGGDGCAMEPRQPNAPPGAAPAAQTAAVKPAAPVPEAERLVRLLVKLLARRAAAGAQLARLKEAEADLLEALRYDKKNERLQADLSEVRAAVAFAPSTGAPTAQPVPQDPASECAADASGAAAGAAAGAGAKAQGDGSHGRSGQEHGGSAASAAVWERAAERFRLRDYEGAAEAFGVALELCKSQGSDLAEEARTLANRAACWLPLERYECCIQDCCAALGALLPLLRAAAAPCAGGSDPVDCGGSGGEAQAEQGSTAAEGAAGESQDGVQGEQEDGSGDAGCAVVDDAVAAARRAQLLAAVCGEPRAPIGEGGQAASSMSSGVGGCGASERAQPAARAHALAAARSAARMALASGCLKRAGATARLYRGARELYRLLGDDAQVERLRADEERLLAG